MALLAEHAGDVEVLLRPEDLRLSPGGMATVVDADFFGHDMMISVGLPAGETIAVRTSADAKFQVGDAVTITYVGQPAVAFA